MTIGCDSCTNRNLGCTTCPMFDPNLGAMVSTGYRDLPVPASMLTPEYLETLTPVTPPAGPGWLATIMSAASEITKYGVEFAKVALPAYSSAEQFKAQMRELRAARRPAPVPAIAPPTPPPIMGPPAPVIPVANGYAQAPRVLLMPAPNAQMMVPAAKGFDMQAALPWVAGAGALGLVLVVLLMQK